MAYKVPPEEYGMGGCAPMAEGEKEKSQPRAHLPIDPGWFKDLELKQKVTVTLTGTIASLEASKREYGSRNEMCIEVDTVSLGQKEDEGAATLNEMMEDK